VDQGELVGDAGALTPSRPSMTPLRALLVLLGAVLGGVALSVILGSSPAHAAEGTGDWPDIPPGPVATATSSLVGTVDRPVSGAVSTVSGALGSTGVGASIPLVQHSVGAAGDSVATHVPVGAPIVAPITAVIETTLSGVQQVVGPLDPVVAVPGRLLMAPVEHAAATTAGTALLTAAVTANSAVGAIPARQNGAGSDGALPGPVLTGASGSPAAAFGLVLGALALALLGARRRGHDEALPASPTFDLDTSPA